MKYVLVKHKCNEILSFGQTYGQTDRMTDTDIMLKQIDKSHAT